MFFTRDDRGSISFFVRYWRGGSKSAQQLDRRLLGHQAGILIDHDIDAVVEQRFPRLVRQIVGKKPAGAGASSLRYRRDNPERPPPAM
ncbi:hypothetical protein F2981_00675 [Sinorhizobium meliloti]|nr:hypothetical protein [Sinorhizobium meliloti]